VACAFLHAEFIFNEKKEKKYAIIYNIFFGI